MIKVGRHVLVLAVLLVSPCRVPTASADMAVEDLDRPSMLHVEVIVDFGTSRRSTARVRQIGVGDPFDRITASENSIRRVPEILALNPGLETRTLHPGARIIYPPIQGDPGWLIAARSAPSGEFVPLGDHHAIPTLRYETRLCAIRLDKLSEFRAHPDSLDPSWYCEARDLEIGDRVRADGALAAREGRTIRIERIEDGVIEWSEVSRVMFDDAGNTITVGDIAARETQRNLGLATLGFLGLLGLVLVIHRRLRAAR